MGRCETCGKRIGILLGRKWRKVDGGKHCVSCVEHVMQNRRERVLQEIMGPPARVLFQAPVISRDLDFPSNHRRYTGAVIFSDKGIIFTQHGEYQLSNSGAALLGVVGALYDSAVEKKRRTEACQTLSDKVDIGVLIHEAEQLFLFRLAEIRKLKCTNQHCHIKGPKSTTFFQWVDGKNDIKPHRALISAYVDAVNMRRDVVSDCEDLLNS